MLRFYFDECKYRRTAVNALTHSFIETNGIRLHITEKGEGKPVLLLHGFPETSFSWRHQLDALAEAGYHAIAPDLRGYGLSDSPVEFHRYTILDIMSDLIGLLDALNIRQVAVIGNDWGANIAWQCVQIRPDRFHAIVALGVPFMARAPLMPSHLFPQNDQTWFYTIYFSQPLLAAQELEQDISTSLKKIYFWASSEGSHNPEASHNPFSMLSKQDGLLGSLPLPDNRPKWLTQEDFEVFVNSFKKSGFSGGLNYYRNLDQNWEQQGAFHDLKIKVPALYLVGEHDTGLAMPGMQQIIAEMPKFIANLQGSHIIPNSGHWLQQEAPDQVNQKMIDFLHSLES